MKDSQPRTIRLEDYRPPAFLIRRTGLRVELEEEATLVEARLEIERNPAAEPETTLSLDGQGLELLSLSLDGRSLAGDAYTYDGDKLCIASVPERFVLESTVRISPKANTALEGLYCSRGMFCTQCEAEGFRRISFFLDRPDVLSLFSTTIVADAERYPVLLSNGNAVGRGKLEDGRHWVRWDDPWPKPCYLYALVGGRLACVEDRFETMSGRGVDLRLYVESKDLDKCDFALHALKQAMRWDEEVYGREYDLDVFMIVAVDDFNMGAMENKGLNIFNTAAVLANPEITTDTGFLYIAGVVAHEYFHNWSGNRVTCRDWFQLSLKEGFTVFRDQEFSADTGSRAVKRIEDVVMLRGGQFPEDDGPLAHPVRPDSYIEISNFYTRTVYEKGAEVVRMIRELIGDEAFRRGTDLYFERHDGQAVTTEDFVRAMEEASGRDLGQFRLWYTQAGTPRLAIRLDYDAQSERCTLHVAQRCPPTPGQADKQPMHIPLRIGLIAEGGSLPLVFEGEREQPNERVLELREAEQVFRFVGVRERPVPSLLRGFSAPVKLEYQYAADDLALLMRRDSDGFARWDASQSLAVRAIADESSASEASGVLLRAFRELLRDEVSDPAMLAKMLSLPSEVQLADLAEVVDPLSIHRRRHALRMDIAEQLREELLACYRRNQRNGAYSTDAASIAARSLKNVCLAYLALLDDQDCRELTRAQYDAQRNMTDVLAALSVVVHYDTSPGRSLASQLLEDFHARWRHEALVVNTWFQVQATRPGTQTLYDVIRLRTHADFELRNPNKVRSLIGAFCSSNPSGFHREDGEGYRFLLEQITELDPLNPQIASRLVTPLVRWRRYQPVYGEKMHAVLRKLRELPQLSRDSYEVVSKSIA